MKQEQQYKPLSRMSRKTLMVAVKVFAETKKRMRHCNLQYAIIPCISFEDLGVSFQNYTCLDLRDKGFVVLNSTCSGKCGVSIKRRYLLLNFQEFYQEVKNTLL